MIDGDADKTISAGARCTIVRDVGGRITGYTHTNNGVAVPSLDQSFGYDNLNRLRNVTLASATTQYTYDATGNRTSKVVGATTYTNTISSTSNRVTQTQDVGGTFSVAYDNAGNITGDGSNTYTYSDRGRMATAVNAGGTVSYQYNALNLRMSKTGPTALVPTGAAYFVYDEQGQLLGEYDANGAPVYETIYLGAMPVGALKRTGTAGASNLAVSVYNVHADHLGAARIITRPSDKAIVWRWDTAESYGGSAANQNPNSLGVFAFNQRFPGQVFDAETGLFQNWNREYNPRIGRYVQSDPIGLAGGINTYLYANGSPLIFTDPEGLCGRDLGSCMSGPNNPLKKNPDFHEYETLMVVCKLSATCTRDSVFNAVRVFPTPAGPVRDGINTCDVSDIGGNKVAHVVDQQNYALFNITMPGHMFEPGYVYRNVFVDANGNVVLRTYGEGTGGSKGFNTWFGKNGWPVVDVRIQKSLRR